MRHLLTHEAELLLCLLREAGMAPVNISVLLVSEMDDGGMGSLYIAHPRKDKKSRRMGRQLAEKQFMDNDNIPILVTLNVDEDEDLYEIDIWKVDFSPIKRYPVCSSRTAL